MEIKVTTTELTITSAIPADMFDRALDFNPKALVLKDADNNEAFKVEYSEKLGAAAISSFGVTFTSVDENGKLQTIIPFQKQYASKEKAVAAVKKDKGNALAALAEAEPIIMAQIAAATDRVNAVFEGV